jgi:D12 class N6 adenine-specific DNA methyltransferase
MPPSKKTLGIMQALPPYMGGKRKLLAPIFREIAKNLDMALWKRSTLIDGFMGGGAVSLYAKVQFGQVIANDYSDRSTMIARALLENNGTRLSEMDCRLFLAGIDSVTAFCQGQPDWFIPATAAVIDRGLAYADSIGNDDKRWMLRLLAWEITLNSAPKGGDFTSRRLVERAMSGELKASGVTQAKFAFRPPDIRDVLRYAERINSGIFHGQFRFTQADALEKSKDWGADVVYLDPPYAGDYSYEQYYQKSDEVLAQRELPKSSTSPLTDPKTAEDCMRQLAENVYKAGTKLVLWSNSDEAIPRDRHMEILGKYFDCYPVPIKHFHSLASSSGNDGRASGESEVLLVGRAK